MSDIIKDAKQLLDGATPAPWKWSGYSLESKNSMSFDTSSQDNAVCPYCGYADIDSWELLSDWNECGTTWCPDCDEEYEWSVHISHSYTTNKIGQDND